MGETVLLNLNGCCKTNEMLSAINPTQSRAHHTLCFMSVIIIGILKVPESWLVCPNLCWLLSECGISNQRDQAAVSTPTLTHTGHMSLGKALSLCDL